MNRRQDVAQLIRSVMEMPVAAPVTEATSVQEAVQVARDAAQAFFEEMERLIQSNNGQTVLFDQSKSTPEGFAQGIMDKPAQSVTFNDIERLARAQPDRVLERWETLKATAREDVAGGWRAARAIDSYYTDAYDRACYLALREQLHQAWRPRHAGEAMLVDEMAQYEMVRLYWLRVLAGRSHQPAKFHAPDHAIKALEAGRMIERMQRLYQNALRTLLSLRRGKGPTIIQRSGQVNVTVGPQLNVHEDQTVASDNSPPPPLRGERGWG